MTTRGGRRSPSGSASRNPGGFRFRRRFLGLVGTLIGVAWDSGADHRGRSVATALQPHAAMDELKAGLGAREPMRLLLGGPIRRRCPRQLDARAGNLAGPVGTGAFELSRMDSGRPGMEGEREIIPGDDVPRTCVRAAVLGPGSNTNAVEVVDGVLRAWPRMIAAGASDSRPTPRRAGSPGFVSQHRKRRLGWVCGRRFLGKNRRRAVAPAGGEFW